MIVGVAFWAVVLAGFQQGSAPQAAQRAVAPPEPVLGEESSYAFREPPVNGEGAKSLADLKGRPVVLEYWGTT